MQIQCTLWFIHEPQNYIYTVVKPVICFRCFGGDERPADKEENYLAYNQDSLQNGPRYSPATFLPFAYPLSFS